LLAGLSDDDPAGITTYSILRTEHGYRLLWIVPASTVLLAPLYLVAVRIGAVTGKGFVAVVRERWGHRWGYAVVVGLVFANFGTICAEYAGVTAAGSLITLVVVLESFARVKRVLLAISATLALYIVNGVLAGPV